jgi:hypothetical protein
MLLDNVYRLTVLIGPVLTCSNNRLNTPLLFPVYKYEAVVLTARSKMRILINNYQS